MSIILKNMLLRWGYDDVEDFFPPNDLEMLSENSDGHRDPIGMLDLLLSYRNRQARFPESNIPGECKEDALSSGSRCRQRHGLLTCLSKRFSGRNGNTRKFCRVIRSKVDEHNRQVESELSNKLKQAIKTKESEVK